MHNFIRATKCSRLHAGASSKVENANDESAAAPPSEGALRASCRVRGGARRTEASGIAPSAADELAAPHPFQTAPSGLRSSVSKQLSTGWQPASPIYCSLADPLASSSTWSRWTTFVRARPGVAALLPPLRRLFTHRVCMSSLTSQPTALRRTRRPAIVPRRPSRRVFASADILLEFLADHQRCAPRARTSDLEACA